MSRCHDCMLFLRLAVTYGRACYRNSGTWEEWVMAEMEGRHRVDHTTSARHTRVYATFEFETEMTSPHREHEPWRGV
jgi:hypothetical protein